MKQQEETLQFYTLGSQGLVMWAICTSLPLDEAIAHANSIGPTGISGKWQLSDEKFGDSLDNPHDCPEMPGHKHYLLEC